MTTKNWFTLLIGPAMVVGFIAASAAADGPKGTAVIKGKATLKGEPKKLKPLDMSGKKECANLHTKAQPEQGLLLYKDMGNALPYVFVYVKRGVDATYDPPQQPIVLDQKGCMYAPHVFGMVAGQGMDIKNSDKLAHNIHSLAKKNNPFNIQQPQPMTKELRGTDTFTTPEVMVRIKCDVHGWMSSYCGVLTHPFFDATKDHYAFPGDKPGNKDKWGTYEIKELPAGEYEIEAWHETYGAMTKKVAVKDGETTELNFEFETKSAQAPQVREVDLSAMAVKAGEPGEAEGAQGATEPASTRP